MVGVASWGFSVSLGVGPSEGRRCKFRAVSEASQSRGALMQTLRVCVRSQSKIKNKGKIKGG